MFNKISGVFQENREIILFPGVFQGPGRKFQNSRSFPGEQGNYPFSGSFPGPLKKISKFQEFSRNSRSSEHNDTVKIGVQK